jgi:tRNA A-37 threonylcarbamoyl transferase component Bud32
MTKSITPSTATPTSLKSRPTLRLVLRVLWVVVAVYIARMVVIGGSAYVNGWFGSSNLLQQITKVGFNLLSFSTIDIICDLYILLGYFGLATVLFLHRSDDWFAIFLSIVIMAFGISVTNGGNNLAANPSFEYWMSPIMIVSQSGIILFGWMYPDGRLSPNWLKYVLPVMLVNMALLYWPGSPLFGKQLSLSVFLGNSLFWYFSAAAMMIHRYRSISSPNQRQQIRYVFTGMMGPLLWFIIFYGVTLFFPTIQTDATLSASIYRVAMRILSIGLFLVFPACLTIAISRFKLFDIDLIINRAIVYGALTVTLVTVFGFVLLIVTTLLNNISNGSQTTLGLTLSAIAAGALFQPARKALQRFVDRTFYHINIDYLKTPVGIKNNDIGGDTITQAPVLFSNYTNLTLVGKGGMAEVYRAEHPVSQRVVAIKVLLANLAEEEQFRKRFQRESQALAGLEHSNIVKIYDYGVENKLYFMVMEYLNGMNLSALLKQTGQIPFEEAVPILENVADALDYAHKSGVIHRDVKPSNVMLDTSLHYPRAVLTDFGIVKLSSAFTNITASAIIGTFDYIAPEQIEGSREVDGRADIYSLGVMTYQIISGTLPFRRNPPGALLLAHMTTPPPDLRELVPTVSRQTSQAIQKAMAKNPDERFATASEFVQALK